MKIGKYFRAVYVGDSKYWALIGIIAIYIIGLFAVIETARLGYLMLAKILKMN
jgi:hypothetical protein